jgi:hypothetical protein
MVIFAQGQPRKVTDIHLPIFSVHDSMTWLIRLPLMPRIVAAMRFSESRVNVRAGKGKFLSVPLPLAGVGRRVADVWMVVV